MSTLHHDNRKQSRVRHWLTTQAISFAFTGLLLREAITSSGIPERRLLLSMAILVGILRFVTSILFAAMDARARQFTLFHRFRLCELEEQMRSKGTFTRLAQVLNRITDERLRAGGIEHASGLYAAWLTQMTARGLYRQIVPDLRDILAAAKEQLVFVLMMTGWIIFGTFLIAWGWPILRGPPLV